MQSGSSLYKTANLESETKHTQVFQSNSSEGEIHMKQSVDTRY